MSIPPLVCSTPPPPDQCEDDKDHEDFDLSYSLSQEDDDDENNDYNYGNFSSFNHYQSASDKPLETKNHEIIDSINTGVQKEILNQYELNKELEQSCIRHDDFETNDINENKLRCEEDMNIEDLNLKLDEEIVTNIVENSDDNDGNDQNTNSLKDLNIPCSSNDSSQDDENTNGSSDENVIDTRVVIKESYVALKDSILGHSNNDEIKNETVGVDVDFSNLNDQTAETAVEFDMPIQSKEMLIHPDEFPDKFQQSSAQFDVHSPEKVIDDDFGDFDDFHLANTKNSVTSVVDSSNPWENNDSNDSDFGSFTANFEDNKMNSQDISQVELGPISNSDPLKNENQVNEEESHIEDDDFGDFDDFKSSAVKMESNEVTEEELCHELSVLNLQLTDNEHHIMESITKVLTSVFIEDISEPEVEFEGKLESLLSETWGHLMETDEREPYIVNWNNSLGQKTLLKSLCIDSRNILFGPKWSSHMPKYAANLSVAPLQPQKQASAPSNVAHSEPVADKASTKATTWSDPFISDGQESCNTEKESSSAPPRPTDLDVFEAALSTKSEKIYSSTLSVQPIRQISLPDTHIFTPTDSEIPRSKTIHYDHSPTVRLPQPILANSKHVTADSVKKPTNAVETNPEDDDSEYWEFQNFKSTPDCSSFSNKPEIPPEKNFETALTVNALPKASIAYQSELLQPIKVEPSMPTLNWPDPGEVKDTYDDFTDFVSISSTEKQDNAIIQAAKPHVATNNVIKYDNLNDLKEKTEEPFVPVMKTSNEVLDDDFDTFQSALPSKGANNDFKKTTSVKQDNQIPISRVTDFDNVSPKSNSIKSESLATISRPNEVLTQYNVSFDSNTVEFQNRSTVSSGPQIQTSLLQPTAASFSAINTQNQRTTQILQPLSLESYSQINWPSPGIDLQDLSRFNPVETLQSLKSDLSVSGLSKGASPLHTQKTTAVNQASDDDVWGDFVSSKPKQQQSVPKKPPVFAEDDEWTDFISSPSVKPQNGLNTISLNVHTNSNNQKSVQNKFPMKASQAPVDIPTLNYITPKSNPHKTYNSKHFQNL